MPFVIWSDQFATGIDSIDQQHQQLFEAVNKLHEAFTHGDPRDQVKKSLLFLIQYTVDHFSAEEDHMQRLGYPGFAAHAAEHTRLVGQVTQLKHRLDAGQSLAEDVTAFLADWLKHHIHQVDMAYVEFFKARGVE